VAGEPGNHLRLLMGGVVVEGDVDDLAGRDLCLDGVEEADELLATGGRPTTGVFDPWETAYARSPL
jgi:hypothetical protein